MVRIVVKSSSAMPIGDWPTNTEYLTFDVDAPELEAFLAAEYQYAIRTIVGGHVIKESADGK